MKLKPSKLFFCRILRDFADLIIDKTVDFEIVIVRPTLFAIIKSPDFRVSQI